MIAVAQNKADTLTAISTAGGKTVVAFGPILYEEGVPFWLSPLRALKLETKFPIPYSVGIRDHDIQDYFIPEKVLRHI